MKTIKLCRSVFILIALCFLTSVYAQKGDDNNNPPSTNGGSNNNKQPVAAAWGNNNPGLSKLNNGISAPNISSRKQEEDQDVPELQSEVLQIRPNPNNGMFEISFVERETSDVLLRIFDVTGREVFRDDLYGFSGYYFRQVRLTCPSGPYFIIRGAGGKIIMRDKILCIN